MTDWVEKFLKEGFQPHPLLRSGHAQTCMAAWWKGPQAAYQARQHVIDTTEGDRLVVHEDSPISWQDGDATALLIHGLGGCHRSAYMVRIAAKLLVRGVRVFRMDMRGSGAGATLARHPGHAGRSEDIARVVNFVKQQASRSRLTAVGFSLGGNVLLKWLGEVGSAGLELVDRACAVSVPLDLDACVRNLQRPDRRLYDRWFVRGLTRQFDRRGAQLAGFSDLRLPRVPRTLFEFDDVVTGPLSGFRGAEEYYARSSCIYGLSRIEVPTLVISAQDDPLIPPEVYARAEASQHVTLHVTSHGGHVGFFGRGKQDRDWHWIDWRIVDAVTHP